MIAGLVSRAATGATVCQGDSWQTIIEVAALLAAGCFIAWLIFRD